MLSVLLRYTDSDYIFGIFWPLCRLPFFDIRILNTPFWYLLAIVSFVLLWYTDSDYPFRIFWPLCRLLFFDIQILITPLVSFDHCVVRSSSIYGFWLPLWYLLTIVLSVLLRYRDSDLTLRYLLAIVLSVLLRYTDSDLPLWFLLAIVLSVILRYRDSDLIVWYLLAIVLSVLLRYTNSDYPIGIFWAFCPLLFFDIWILITTFVSFGHCVVSFSLIYRFWLPFWYLLAIVSSAFLRYTDCDYPFGILWPLCRQFFFDIQILITLLVSCGHCVVCSSSIYRFWLPLWYLVAIVSSALLRYTDSDYPFGILWPLCRLLFFDIQLLITPLAYFGHCFVSSSSIYWFWLSLWYLLAIMLSVLLRYTDSDYPFGIFWPSCCQFFFDIQILITHLVSFGHCVVSSSSIYRFWLPLWYLLAIVLSVLLRYTDSDYPFGILWPLCCQFFFDIRILITRLVSFDHCVVSSSSIYGIWLPLWYLLAIVLSVLLRYTDSDYPFGIFWPLCRLPFFDIRILITPLVSFGHCVVCSSLIYRFWLPLWYLLAIVLSVLLRYTDSDYTFGIFWPLCRLPFFDIRILITPLVSFGHCVVCSSLIYRFWLPLWYLLTIVLSVLLRYTDSDYPFDIFWPLCCQFFFDIRNLITPLVSFGHCVVRSSSIYRFWLPLWYLVAIVSSALLRYTDSDYPFDILCPLLRLLFFDIEMMITPLVYFGHCVVCSSSIYRFWLPIWYLVAIVSSAFLRYTGSHYHFCILWPLCRLLFFDIQILITPLVSCGHCVVCSSSIYRFRLSLWYLVAIVSSALHRYTDSDYPFGIFWLLFRLLFFDIQMMITPLVSFSHCVVCSSSIYRFSLPLLYLVAIVSSALLRYTDSDYHFGIFWPLCRLPFFDIQILITPLVSFDHYFVCFSSIYRFWLLLWYLVAIVSSVHLRYTDSDYPFDILWPLCRLLFFDLQIWLPLWYFVAIVSSALLRYRDDDYPFGIVWPLCRLLFFDIQILITLWYLVAIVSSPHLRSTDSDYPFGILWPLCRLLFFDLQILITPLVSSHVSY